MAHSEPEEPRGDVDDNPFADLDADLTEADLPDDEPEPVAMPSAPQSNQPTAAPNKRSGRKPLLLSGVIGLLVIMTGSGGWLGWRYWNDRESLTTLQADLLLARDDFEEKKSRPEESGEAAAARQLAARIEVIVAAPWWDHIVVRIIDQQALEDARSQGADLSVAAEERTANRAWWTAQRESSQSALAVETRTLGAIQGVLDDLQSAQPPHPSAGGFTDELIAEAIAELQQDIVQMSTAQDLALARFASLQQNIAAATDLAALAEASAALAEPLPIDRNPPAIEAIVQSIKDEARAVAELLGDRDAMVSELTAVLASIQNADLETTSLESMQSKAADLARLEIPADPRYEAVRERAASCAQGADAARAVLAERDRSLAWIAERSNELSSIDSLDAMAAFASVFEGDDSPKSELAVAISALEDLAARIGAQSQVLEEERRQVEESIARAAACAVSLREIEKLFEVGSPARAGELILAALPESREQYAAMARLTDEFPKMMIHQLSAMEDASKESGNWDDTAGTFRQCLGSPAVATLAPQFASESIDWWTRVLLAEDRTIYESISVRTQAPYRDLAPTLGWYLDSTRTRGATAPMEQQVRSLLSAIEAPAATILIEGIEWNAPICEDPHSISVVVTVHHSPYKYELHDVVANQTSLLGGEVFLQLPHESQVTFDVNCRFECADVTESYSGSGVVTMDDLRVAGRFALPFWNDADYSKPTQNLLVVSIPDEEIRKACELPKWIDPREPIVVPETAPVELPEDAPADAPIEETER